MGQADPILTRLGAGPAVKKLVETALALSSSQDPQQRNHAYSFMESAIKELENEDSLGADAGLGPHSDDAIDAPKLKEEHEDNREKKIHEQDDDERREKKIHEQDDDERREKKIHEQDDEEDEHKIHEEELSNHNQGHRLAGSEQSTHNTAPYPGEGIDTTTGEKPMQDMDDTVNQWSETNGIVVPGVPPIQNMNGAPPPPPQPGLAPDIAQEMGMHMPAPPAMDTNQMMRQMQYTVNHVVRNYDKKVVAPMMQHIKAQTEALKEAKGAIKQLSIELRETKANNGSMKLDLDTMRNNATATFRETEPQLQGFMSNNNIQTVTGVQPLPNIQRHKIAIARSEIEQMDKILNSNKNPMYN